LWRIPEDRWQLLGRPSGKRILELGCGAGRWSLALAERGASTVGLDVSKRQLAKARGLTRRRGRRAAWVRADAERLPFRARSFDVLFADWGAMTFCDPRRTLPEASRVLRPGGRLVFATSSPFRVLAEDARTDRIGPRLRRNYFGLGRVDYPGEVNFVLTYGAWIALFRAHGLAVEALLETQAPLHRRSSYLGPEAQRWGRRWPLESIWVLTREPLRERCPRPSLGHGRAAPERGVGPRSVAGDGNL
jgi:SAM-dependent methyltransferase